MFEKEETQKPLNRTRKFLRLLAVATVILALIGSGFYLGVKLYLLSSFAPLQVSRFVTGYLKYPVTIKGLNLNGDTFIIKNLVIGNPPSFPSGLLFSSREITISPDWPGLLRGTKSWNGISVRRGNISLARNDRGEWNFQPLVRLLSESKGGGETYLRRFSVSDSSLTAEGFHLGNINLNLNDLSTKGTTGSRFLLTCKDAGGHPVRIEGTGRLGSAPDLEIAVEAPAISGKTFAGAVGKRGEPLLADCLGSLNLKIRMHGGNGAAEGKFALKNLTLAAGKGTIPFGADLEFAAGYDETRDQIAIDRCSFQINGVVRGEASAILQQLKGEKSFAVDLAMARLDLQAAFQLIPPELRRDLMAAGQLNPSVAHITGDARNGITGGGASFSLRGVEVASGGTLLVKGLDGDVSFLRNKAGWQTGGRLYTRKGAGGRGIVQDLEIPFSASLSDRFALLKGEMPAITALVSGIAVEGGISLKPGTKSPLTLRLATRQAPLSRLNPLFSGKKIRFDAGTAAFSLQGSGISVHEFAGEMKGELAGVRVESAGKIYTLSKGVADAAFRRSMDRLAVAGMIDGSGEFTGRKGNLAVSYRLDDRQFTLTDLLISIDDTRLRLASVAGLLPQRGIRGETARYPVRLKFSGGSARKGDAALDGLSGEITADYLNRSGKSWLEGDGLLAINKIEYRRGETGSLGARFKLSGTGVAAEVSGKLLKGSFIGRGSFNPFDPKAKAGFRFKLDGADLAAASSLLPPDSTARAASGRLDGRLEGDYDSRAGLRLQFDGEGRGISLAGKNGKTLLADAGFRARGDMAGDTIVVTDWSVSAGNGISLRGAGNILNPLSPKRDGTFSFSMPATPLDSLLKTSANMLPGILQEAASSGTVETEGKVRLSGSRTMVSGSIRLKKGGLEIPAQGIKVTDISGTVPVSLDLSGRAGTGKAAQSRFSRENFSSLVVELRRKPDQGEALTIGSLRIGGVDLGKTAMIMIADNGLMELKYLESGLFEGALRGEGFFRYGKYIEYGASLAVESLSLRSVCNTMPRIAGYISGKVNGIVGITGGGPGVKGLGGQTEIWAFDAPDEKMKVSKEFLQKLAGKNLKGIFVHGDRSYDRGEIRGSLEDGYLTFQTLHLSHVNLFGVKDISVEVAPVQNRIALEHLYSSIKEAVKRGKVVGGEDAGAAPPIQTEFKWEE